MKVKTQILITFGLIAMIVPIYSAINYWSLAYFQKTISILINSDELVVKSAEDISYYLLEIDDVVSDVTAGKTDKINAITIINKNIDKINKSLINWIEALNIELKDPETKPEIVRKLQDRVNDYNNIKSGLESTLRTIPVYINNLSKNSSNNEYLALQNAEDPIRKALFWERKVYGEDIQNDQMEMYKSLGYIKNIETFLYVIIFVIILILSEKISRSLTNRLKQLNETAESIAEGNYSVTVKDNSRDEIGELSRSFNKMALSIQTAQQYIENIIQTMPNIFILTTSDFRIARVNHTTVSKLGYTEDELLKMNFESLMDPQQLDFNMNAIFDSLKIKLFHKDGTKITVIMSSSHMIINNQKEILYIAQDVSLLQTAEERMLMEAREAGMSEIATSVLHNVGNVMNSINISVVTIQEKIADSKMEGLNKLSQLMQEHKNDIVNFITNHFSSQRLPEYLLLLSECWQENKELINQELIYLKNNLNHVDNIIHAQQSINILTSLVQVVSVNEILNDIIAIYMDACEKANITIECNIMPVREISADRVKLMQILANLVKNSIDSLIEYNHPAKKVELLLKEKDETHYFISVRDNGMGIDPDNILKIFTYGYTTKIKGHGFGLHSCANNAKEMGGILNAFSEGLGKGATFTLELPYQTKLKS